MGSAKVLAYLLPVLFLASFVNAATIYGVIYDLSLNKVNNAKVQINTLPKQQTIAKNGTYSFEVSNGAYTIKAQLMQRNTVVASVEENITIKQPGVYVLDLILFPEIDEELEEDIEINGGIIDEGSNRNTVLLVLFVILFIVGVIAGAVYYRKARKKKEPKAEDKVMGKDEDLEQMIAIIKREGGRITQKEIRKEIPLSEAKISLMVAELEHNGVVEKIKKGRGNIIILKKK